MALLQNTKPKIPKVVPFLTKIWFFVKKTKVEILDGHEQKIMKIDNRNICKTKFSVTLWDADETEKLQQKTTYFDFSAFLISNFSWYFIVWTENIQKDHFWIFC